MRVVVLSGGVGGARFVQGVVGAVPADDVTVVGNVGDDVEVLGLHVSPDLDSILYALAGLNDEERGWGRASETWRFPPFFHALLDGGVYPPPSAFETCCT